MTASEANRQRVLALLAIERQQIYEEANTIETKAPAKRRGGPPLTSSDRRENFQPALTSPTSEGESRTASHSLLQQA